MRAFYALFVARNKEFLRDRATLAWNFLFPILAVFALALIFSGDERDVYKVALVGVAPDGTAGDHAPPPVVVHQRTGSLSVDSQS